MKNFGIIKDSYYPKNNKEFRQRRTVRAIVVKEGKIALMHIVCHDEFGPRNHYELPGGGVDFDSDVIGIRREIREELGYEITDIRELGEIYIEYNLLNRIDGGIIYLAKATKFIGTSYTDDEMNLFKETIWVSIEEITSFYANKPLGDVSQMIHQRDFIMIKEALIYLNKGNLE